MLRSRFRLVTSKQTLMATDQSPQQSHAQNPTSPVSSFLSSPKFKGFITQNNYHSGNEALISPNSVLDTALTRPFWYDKRNHFKSPRANKHSWENSHLVAKNVGLKLIDTLEADNNQENSMSKVSNKMVLCVASKLRVKIPHLQVSSNWSPNSQELQSGSASSKCQFVSEMEQSEDYTCVTAHGPNPTTTHIFNNSIMESYYSLSDKSKAITVSTTTSPEKEKYFLSFCYTCQKKLEQTKDIYIYRGEKAFCSRGCRYQEMLLDGAEDAEF